MVKFDVEGAELMVLKGARNMLKTMNPPVWQLELGGYSKKYGITTDDVIDFMRQQNYEAAVYLSEVGKLVYTTTPWLYGRENTLFISSSKKHWVKNRLEQMRNEKI